MADELCSDAPLKIAFYTVTAQGLPGTVPKLLIHRRELCLFRPSAYSIHLYKRNM